MRRLLPLALALAGLSCGEPETPPDADLDAARDAEGQDAGPPAMDVVLEASADPAERTDCPASAPAPGEARAKHVTCDSELVRGALAMGRVGDVVLENAVARFVVRAGDESATTIGGPPGGVIDAAPQGGVDLVKEILPLFDLSSIRPTELVVLDAGGDGEARVRVLFEAAALGLIETVVPGLGRPARVRGQLDYVLRADEPFLRVEVTASTSVGVPSAIARVGLVALLGGQEEVQPGWGVLEGDATGGAGHRILAEREEGALGLGLASATGAALIRVGTIHLLQGARTSFLQGSLARFEARLAVGGEAAEAYAGLAEGEAGLAPFVVTGPPGDRVEVLRDGTPILRSRLGADGRASVPLAPGTYALRAGFDGSFAADAEDVAHGDTGTEHALSPAARGILRVAAQVEGDATAPVRVTVERAGEEALRFVAIGPTERRLPPGPARVTVSHGLEHDVVQADVMVTDGAVTELAPSLDHVLDTSGWVSVDLHLHSELSTDSTHRVEDALRMIAAEHVEVVSSTDHDFVTDYPRISAGLMGVEGRVVLVPGEEVSTTVFGHVNGYPLAPEPALAGAGAIVWFERTPAEVFAGLRARGDDALGGALVQVNHPRLENGFFDAVGLDRETGHATAMPAALELPAETDLDDFSFDVLEVWNGYTRGDNEASFEDYLALFAAGRAFTMVGNSDTHRPGLPAGSPRSFVRVTDDAPGAFGWAEVAASLRAREVTVAGGLFVTAEPAGPRAGGSVPVHVRVQAPPWAEADRLRIYAGRSVAVDRPIAPSSLPVRLDETIDVPLGGAAFVVVRADGSRAPEPMQHFAPYGVTNAVVVP